MKLLAPPIVSEKDFERLLKLERAQNTTLRHYGEMWKAEAVRRGAEITKLLTRDVEREKEMIVLRERNSKLETQLRAQGGVPTLVVVVNLTYQAKHGKPPPKSRRRVRLPVYSTVFCGRHNIRFFQSQWPAGATASKETDDLFAMLRPIKNQGGHRGHPGMVRTNSSSLLNSLYPFMPEIP